MGWMPQPKDKDWLNGYKNKTPYMLSTRDPPQKQRTHTDWKWRAGKRYSTQIETKRKQEYQYSYQKKDFEIKAVERDKERHYIMIKGSIQEEDIIIINIYAPNRRRQWHPTPVLLPGKSHGRRSLVCCSPWGREESDTTERLHFHFTN